MAVFLGVLVVGGMVMATLAYEVGKHMLEEQRRVLKYVRVYGECGEVRLSITERKFNH